MSGFWLGVVVAFACYFGLQTVLSIAFFGRRITIDRGTVATDFALMVIAFALANLIHMGFLG